MTTCDMSRFDEHFMRMALREAEKAASDGEVPLGCIIVEPAIIEPAHDGHPAVYDPNPTLARILGRAHNQTEGLADATGFVGDRLVRQMSVDALRRRGVRILAEGVRDRRLGGRVEMPDADVVRPGVGRLDACHDAVAVVHAERRGRGELRDLHPDE